jgi:methylase of polypeptide subunit release factors
MTKSSLLEHSFHILQSTNHGCSSTALHEIRWMMDKLLHDQLKRTPPSSHDHRHHLTRTLSLLHSPPRNEYTLSSLKQSFESLTPQSISKLESWVHSRSSRHKPLQYILGTQPFCGLELKVRPPILIPRWETEEWVQKLAEAILRNSSHMTSSSLPSSGSLFSISQHFENPRNSTEPPFRILDVCRYC